MSTTARGSVGPDTGAPAYARHRPEQTLLYRLVEAHYPALEARLAAEGRSLPRYVAREFEDFLACGRLEHGFLRLACDGCRAERLVAFSCKRRGFCPSCGARRTAESAAHLVDEVFPERPVRRWVLSVPHPLRFPFANDPEIMGAALGVVHRCLASHLIGKAGLSKRDAQTGAVTLIQRFGGALNLNVHFHMLLLDGVYVERADGTLRFRRVGAPTTAELEALTVTLARRIGRLLERRGLLERDAENAWLADDGGAAPGAIDSLRAASITYRVAIGSHAGRKAFTVQTLLPVPDEPLDDEAPARTGDFSLHAGVRAGATERRKLERLCRYISRPALSEKRLSLSADGQVRYRFKTPWRDGTTDVVLDPLDFLARLAALVPRPRVNLTRFQPVRAQQSPSRTHRPAPAQARRCRGLECRARRAVDRRRRSRREPLGSTLEARVRHRHRVLHRLRRAASDPRLHRGPTRHRRDPDLPGAKGRRPRAARLLLPIAPGARSAPADPGLSLRLSP